MLDIRRGNEKNRGDKNTFPRNTREMIYRLKFVNVMEKNRHSTRQISYNKEGAKEMWSCVKSGHKSCSIKTNLTHDNYNNFRQKE